MTSRSMTGIGSEPLYFHLFFRFQTWNMHTHKGMHRQTASRDTIENNNTRKTCNHLNQRGVSAVSTVFQFHVISSLC